MVILSVSFSHPVYPSSAYFLEDLNPALLQITLTYFQILKREIEMTPEEIAANLKVAPPFSQQYTSKHGARTSILQRTRETATSTCAISHPPIHLDRPGLIINTAHPPRQTRNDRLIVTNRTQSPQYHSLRPSHIHLHRYRRLHSLNYHTPPRWITAVLVPIRVAPWLRCKRSPYPTIPFSSESQPIF